MNVVRSISSSRGKAAALIGAALLALALAASSVASPPNPKVTLGGVRNPVSGHNRRSKPGRIRRA